MAGDQDLSIVVKVQQLTQQAFQQVASELKKLETSAASVGQGGSAMAGGFNVASMGAKGLQSTVAALTGSIGAYAGPFAVGMAIKQTIAWGDSIADLSDDTGIFVGKLLQLETATVGTSTNLAGVAKSAQELSKRLGEGDQGAIAALRQLGLSFNDLKNQDPGQTFIDVVTAASKITNPTERAAAMAALLGKNWKDLGGVVKNLADGVKDVDSSMVDNVRRLGDASDAWDKFWHTLQRGGGSVIGGVARGIQSLGENLRLLDAQTQAWLGNTREVERLAKLMQGDRPEVIGTSGWSAPAITPGSIGWLKGTSLGATVIGPKGGVTPGLPSNLDSVLLDLKQGAERNTVAIRDATESAAALAEAQWAAATFLHAEFAARTKVVTSAEALAAAQNSVTFGYPGYRGSTDPRLLFYNQLQLPANALPGGGLTSLFGATPTSVSPGFAGPGLFAGLGKQLGSMLPGVIVGAFQGGGNVGQSIGGAVGGTVVGGIASSVAKAVGGTLGSTLGSAIPVVGTLLGGLAGKLIGGAFGYKPGAIAQQNADKEIGGLQSQLLQQFGSKQNIAALGPAGQAVVDAWGDRNVQGLAHFKSLVDELNASLERQQSLTSQIGSAEEQLATLRGQQEPTWQKLQGYAEKYGIDIAALGPTFVQLRDNDFATDLASAFEDLTKRGGDVGGILFGMREEIGRLVLDARKFGTSIPENLRPLVEELRRSGNLLDENGDKIEDISDLKWGEPVKTQGQIIADSIADLNKTLKDLRDALAKDLPAAAREGTQGIDDVLRGYRPPAIDVDVRMNDGSPTSTSYARGGVVSRPTRAIIGDSPRGPEIVGDVDFMSSVLSRAMARMGGGPSTPAVISTDIKWRDRVAGRMFLELGFAGAQASGLA